MTINLNEPTVKLNANELAEILKENPTFIASLQNKVEQQELEIEQLKHKLGIEKSRLNLNIQAVSKIKEQAKEIEVLNQSYEILFKHRIDQEKENQLLKKEIKDLRQIVEGTIKQAFYEDDYHKATVKIEILKANLRVVANQLRSGVSKIQQKTMARVIEQLLEDSK